MDPVVPPVVPETPATVKPLSPAVKTLKKNGKKILAGTLMALLLAGGIIIGTDQSQTVQQTISQALTRKEKKYLNKYWPNKYFKSKKGSTQGSDYNPAQPGESGALGTIVGTKTAASAADWNSTTVEIHGTYISGGKRYYVANAQTYAAASKLAASGGLNGVTNIHIPNVIDDPTTADVDESQVTYPNHDQIIAKYTEIYPSATTDLSDLDMWDAIKDAGYTWVPAGVGICDGCDDWHFTVCENGMGMDGVGCDTKDDGGGGGGGSNPSPSPTPSPSPSPSPGFSCVDLTADNTSPELDDTVTFTCEGSFSSVTAPVAYFRYSVDGGSYVASDAVSIDTTTNTADYDVAIDQEGDWSVQCRVCTDSAGTSCTEWGQAN